MRLLIALLLAAIPACADDLPDPARTIKWGCTIEPVTIRIQGEEKVTDRYRVVVWADYRDDARDGHSFQFTLSYRSDEDASWKDCKAWRKRVRRAVMEARKAGS